MKILKESLLCNDLASTLDVVKEVTLVKRHEKEMIIMMPLTEYNKIKQTLYKAVGELKDEN